MSGEITIPELPVATALTGTELVPIIQNGITKKTAVNTWPTGLATLTVATANGLAGAVSGTTQDAVVTLRTSVTGLAKGNGTSFSAAVAGTDYAVPTAGTAILYGNGLGGFSQVTIGANITFVGGVLSATSGGGMTYPSGTGIAVVSAGASWGATLAAPTSAIVGINDSQTLTNKTLTSPTFTTPVLGTPSSGNFGTGTFTWPTFNQSTTGSAASLSANLPVARLNSGTGANATTFWRGDGAWATPAAPPPAGLPVTVVSTTSQTMAAGNHYVFTNVSLSTATLPATPAAADTVMVTFVNALRTNVIARNGSTIQSLSEDLTVDLANLTVTLKYANSTWMVI